MRTWVGAVCFLLSLAAVGCGGSGPSDPTPTEHDIGANDPNVIVAFGDSISDGYDSANGEGYRDDLEHLFAADGRNGIRVLDESEPGSISSDGVERIAQVLSRRRPAVLILLYGTNDEYLSLPKAAVPTGSTSGNLRQIIYAARANKTLVVVSTIPPVCLDRRKFQRANIVEENKIIREMVNDMQKADDGIFLADAWDAFLKEGPPDGCSLINMSSGNHPNEAGYALLARTYFDSLTLAMW